MERILKTAIEYAEITRKQEALQFDKNYEALLNSIEAMSNKGIYYAHSGPISDKHIFELKEKGFNILQTTGFYTNIVSWEKTTLHENIGN